MIRFGHSAFLKFINLNPKPQRTEIRNRLSPSKGGYDFHRSLRLRATNLLMGDKPVGEIVASVAEISKSAERRSATAGLRQLVGWRRRFDGETYEIDDVRFVSPNKVFSVGFDPICGIMIDGQRFALHLWNTMKPDLDTRMVQASLQIFSQLGHESCEEFAVLSLRDGRLYRSDEASFDTPKPELFVSHYERMIAGIGGAGLATGDEVRPTPP